jgi:NADH:flavin oxidoreductase / NADH oxidase family
MFEAVRAAFPHGKPVGIRVSSTDWVEGGWDIHQTIEFAKELKKRNVDWIDVSSGGVSPLQKIPLGPGYQVPLAQAVKEATGITTMAVGLITEAAQAEEIVSSGKADMVALARAMLYDPRWGWHAAAQLGGESQHLRNIGARSPRRRRRCSVRPRSERGNPATPSSPSIKPSFRRNQGEYFLSRAQDASNQAKRGTPWKSDISRCHRIRRSAD